MQNWSGDENEAMKGYIMRAVRDLNDDYMDENGKNAIDAELLGELFGYLYRACDDMTADEAQHYYLNHSNTDVCR